MTAADPVAIALSWALNLALRHFFIEKYPVLRHFIPTLAVIFASGVYAFASAVEGQELTLEAAWRGLIAGAMAVFVHSQWREIVKAAIPEDSSQSSP